MKSIDKVQLETELTEGKYQDYKSIFEKYGVEEAYQQGQKKSELIKAALKQAEKIEDAEIEAEKSKEVETPEQEEKETETALIETEGEDKEEETGELDPKELEPAHKVSKEILEKQLKTVELCMIQADDKKRKILLAKKYDLQAKIKRM